MNSTTDADWLSPHFLIDVTKSWHVAWWAAKLGVSEKAVMDAVLAVGGQGLAVRRYLQTLELPAAGDEREVPKVLEAPRIEPRLQSADEPRPA